MAVKKQKRLGKKHRQASTRPKKGKAPRTAPVTGAATPKQRKQLSAKQDADQKAARTPKKSPEFESRRTIAQDRGESQRAPRRINPAGGRAGARSASHDAAPGGAGSRHEEREWTRAEQIADTITATGAPKIHTNSEPLVAICGRPNVGKSTLFNRLTGTRRSIVGDEPGITRDRIYGEVEWQGRNVRLVDTGGVVPDDEELIPAEIFRQARVALDEADAIIMVVDGRTELAAPDMELAQLLLRSGAGKPLFLAVNKSDTLAQEAAAENYRRLGFKNMLAISAEHNVGIGDLLDEVWAVLPAAGHTQQDTRAEFVQQPEHEQLEGFEDEAEEDMDGGGEVLAPAPDAAENDTPVRARKLRSHGEAEIDETRIAIIGRPNVGKSTLLNALTGSDRAIVSPIAGTTRDAVDEVIEHDGKLFRFIDTAGIRRKGKTKLMAEKLSVIMSRKHLEAADVSLLVIDAVEGVAAADANIGGYAHESGRSVIIVVNKWDLVGEESPTGGNKHDGGPVADQKVYEEQVRYALKYLDYAPMVFLSAAKAKGIPALFKKIELVARERRKRVTTGQMNRFLDHVDFGRASVPMNKRVKIYYMTQAAVAPPTFVLFTDKDVKLHFSYERFLANEIRRAFKFIGSPIWFKVRARNKKKGGD
jgi:GTP-binding protein